MATTTGVVNSTGKAFYDPINFDPNAAGTTTQSKANYYNKLIGQGYTDAEIRAAVQNAGYAQSDDD